MLGTLRTSHSSSCRSPARAPHRAALPGRQVAAQKFAELPLQVTPTRVSWLPAEAVLSASSWRPTRCHASAENLSGPPVAVSIGAFSTPLSIAACCSPVYQHSQTFHARHGSKCCPNRHCPARKTHGSRFADCTSSASQTSHDHSESPTRHYQWVEATLGPRQVCLN